MAKQDGLPRDSRIIYKFKTKPFDFMFQWITGASSSGGVEIGEAMYTASQIRDGDSESWFNEFTAMGNRVLKRAHISEQSNNKISASDSYLRCYSYFRAAPIFLNPREDSRYINSYRKACDLFRKGIDLSDIFCEVLEIPYKQTFLPGYLFKPETRLDKGKTLIMVGGADTFVEDLYFYIGPAALRRGYTLVTVDLPGQGALPWEGLYFTAEPEDSIGAVINMLEKRKDISTEKLGLFGISGGGFLVPRAASKEPRINCVAACSIILDFESIWNTKLLNLQTSFNGKILRVVKTRIYKTLINFVEIYRMRWGVKTNEELIKRCSEMKTNAEEIKCPVLNLIAEQEYRQFSKTRREAQLCKKNIKDYTLIITPANEGADSHSIGTNIRLMSQLFFDWMDSRIG